MITTPTMSNEVATGRRMNSEEMFKSQKFEAGTRKGGDAGRVEEIRRAGVSPSDDDGQGSRKGWRLAVRRP